VGLSGTLDRAALLSRIQTALLIAYAAVLPISMTASWIVLICGLILLVGQILAASKTIRLFANAPLLKKGVLCYFWAYLVFVRNRDLVRSTVFVLLGVGAIAGVFGAIEQVANFHPFGYRYLQGTGFLGGPMSFAGQMEMLAALSVALLLIRTSESKRSQAVFCILAVGNCLGVIFAAERSSWLGFLAAIAVISIAVSWRRFIVLMTAVWSLAMLGWLLVPVFQKRLLPLLSWQNDVSVRVRLFLWQQSIALWQRNPLFGIGLRRFPHFNIPEAIVPGRSVDINHAHSNYMQILATTGIAGLAAYLWLSLCMLLTAWKNYKSGISFERALALGIFGGTVALLVSGAFEYNFGTAHVRLMQWFLLAMLLPINAKKKVGIAS
jgi:O-antigen ligase